MWQRTLIKNRGQSSRPGGPIDRRHPSGDSGRLCPQPARGNDQGAQRAPQAGALSVSGAHWLPRHRQGQAQGARSPKGPPDPRDVRPLRQRAVFAAGFTSRDQRSRAPQPQRPPADAARGRDRAEKLLLHRCDHHPSDRHDLSGLRVFRLRSGRWTLSMISSFFPNLGG